MIISLIPARKGSKGIRNKNTAMLNGKELVNYAVEASLESSFVQEHCVSTNDPLVVDVARRHSQVTIVSRPNELCEDNTPDRPVMLHMIEWMKKEKGVDVEFLVYLRPTTPFKTGSIIDSCVRKLRKNPTFTSVRTVTEVTAVHHPYWMYQPDDNDMLKPFVEGVTLSKYPRRQLLPSCVRLNGVVDVVRADVIKKDSNIYGENIGFVNLSNEESVDIDTQIDLDFCEFLMGR